MRIIKRINPAQILLHAFALYCLGVGCSVLTGLLDAEGLAAMHQFRTKGVVNGELSERMSRFVYYTGFGMLFGVVTGFTTSLVLSIRRRWLWLNSLFALFLLVGLLFLMITFKPDFGMFIWFISRTLNLSAIPAYAVTGLFWTSIALFVLFSSASKKIIAPKHKEKQNLVFQFENEAALK